MFPACPGSRCAGGCLFVTTLGASKPIWVIFSQFIVQAVCGAAPAAREVGAQREAYKTFTNRAGWALLEVAPGVWAGDRPFLPRLLLHKVDVGGRFTVIRLSNGTLWVHAPLALDDELKQILKELGEVKHIVTPNFEHVAYAKQWKEAYPQATSYGPPGFSQKVPVSPVELSGTAPDAWQGEIDLAYLGYERNPFTGRPFFHEVIFVHKPSGILLTADLFWNYPDDGINFATRSWKFGMDRVYRPFYNNLMIGDKGEFAQVMHRIFSDWQWDKILPCHGNMIRDGGKAVLKQHIKLEAAQGR